MAVSVVKVQLEWWCCDRARIEEWRNVLPGGMQQVWQNVMGRVREACGWSLRDFEQGSGVLVQELAGGGAACSHGGPNPRRRRPGAS